MGIYRIGAGGVEGLAPVGVGKRSARSDGRQLAEDRVHLATELGTRVVGRIDAWAGRVMVQPTK